MQTFDEFDSPFERLDSLESLFVEDTSLLDPVVYRDFGFQAWVEGEHLFGGLAGGYITQ
jgi:hypothetical protein